MRRSYSCPGRRGSGQRCSAEPGPTEGPVHGPRSSSAPLSRCAASGERTERERNVMNFDDTPQEAAFRAEAKVWIAANAPRQYEEELKKSSLGRTQLTGANILDVAKAWQKKKADAGWACLHWPKEYGGGGGDPHQRRVLLEG